MTIPSLLEEPGRVDEPLAALGYSAMFTQVATEHRTVIVRRDGADLAAVVPLEHLELLREAVARQEVEQRAASIDWQGAGLLSPPPEAWFNDNDNPFEPEEETPS
jgi:hypothetical protein